MKSLFTFINSLLYILNILNGQCICTILPTSSNPVWVNTVSQLQNALSQANTNNGNMTILLAKGTYTLSSNLLYISSNMKNLTIRGATGNRDDVIIKGQGMNGNVTHIFNVAASHFTVADMTIGWVFYHPIQIHGEAEADSALIHNVKIIDGNEQFIKISGSAAEPNICDGGIIECCHFEFSKGIGNQYYTGGVDGHHCANWIVRNNTFKHLRSPDGNLAEHAVHFWSNSRDIITENNLIINCDRGIGYGLGNDPARGNFGGIIRNNFVHTSRDVGIGIENTPDVKIYNNTVWTDNYFNSIEYRFAGTKNAHITNNLTNKNIALREAAQAVLENNFTNAIASMFVNAGANDYHLIKSDPAVVGKGKVINEVKTDFDCVLRGTTNDIGGDQYLTITDVNSFNESNMLINLFPNPANNFFYIEIKNSNITNVSFQLYNSSGERIRRYAITDQKYFVNTVPLRNGIYFYLIQKDNKLLQSGKLILN